MYLILDVGLEIGKYIFYFGYDCDVVGFRKGIFCGFSIIGNGKKFRMLYERV